MKLGTSVIVLPWHDPMRVAEAVTMLDNLSDGRMILGIGRGLARVEYEGFRVDMDTSRERFVTYAEVVLEGLERGYLEYDGEMLHQPRRDLRPRPRYSFRNRTYAAAVSPESMPIMARLGVGLLVIPQKPWSMVQEDFEVYRRVWAEENPGTEPPPPLSGGFVVVHEDAERAEEMARRYIGGYYGTVLQHYEFAANPHQGVQGYEFYTHVTRYIERHGESGAIDAFVDLMPYGTPDQVLEKVAFIRDAIGIAGFLPNFSFAGMPYDEAERSLRAVRHRGDARAATLGHAAGRRGRARHARRQLREVATLTDLASFEALVPLDHGLCVVVTRRADLTPQSSVVNAGVLAHPVTGDRVVGLVAAGGSRKLVHLRADPTISVVVRAGWQWAAVDGRAELIGPDDPHPGFDDDRVRRLLRDVFTAAGGTHDDWDTYDRVMREERRTAVLVSPSRVYSNPG